MEEEVNQKVVSLTVRTGKLTASVLARAMRDFLDGQKVKPHKYAKGKQSFKQLMEQNAGAMNIEVDMSDIIQKRSDKLIYSHGTALFLLGMSDRVPHMLDITVP